VDFFDNGSANVERKIGRQSTGMEPCRPVGRLLGGCSAVDRPKRPFGARVPVRSGQSNLVFLFAVTVKASVALPIWLSAMGHRLFYLSDKTTADRGDRNGTRSGSTRETGARRDEEPARPACACGAGRCRRRTPEPLSSKMRRQKRQGVFGWRQISRTERPPAISVQIACAVSMLYSDFLDPAST